MKKLTVSTLALVVALGAALPVAAQQATSSRSGETALEMAARTGACGEATVSKAEFVNEGRALKVSCAKNASVVSTQGSAGLGVNAGLIAAGIGIAAVIGIVAASSSSSGTN